ncbi:MAG TPA: aminotransferase class V-fold PLP-dependent enzyme [Selenomonadales bacterium]|nr:aminotransferase class V-fold PLP-dependent enzyme [Selenomonadales bacterium]
MQTYPLESLTLAEAKQLQFRLVDITTRYFRGRDILSQGDLGVVAEQNKPTATRKVEQIIADFFDTEAAVLVQGAGTAAIRWGLYSILQPGQTLLVHDAPLYPTTRVTVEAMGLSLAAADMNDPRKLAEALDGRKPEAALIQHTRQKPEDGYVLAEVVAGIRRKYPKLPILADDNYAALKVRRIGVQCGADLSAFSLFKLLGPEGIGCIAGRGDFIRKIAGANYSGGGQVQGHTALAALRGMIYAPVALALQAEVNEELVSRLEAGEVAGVRKAFLANAQSKVLLVELEQPVAKAVIAAAEELGAAPHPVGAESIYEFVPMVYRVSGTFLAADPSLEDRMLRINPLRAGADTVIRILGAALAQAGGQGRR